MRYGHNRRATSNLTQTHRQVIVLCVSHMAMEMCARMKWKVMETDQNDCRGRGAVHTHTHNSVYKLLKQSNQKSWKERKQTNKKSNSSNFINGECFLCCCCFYTMCLQCSCVCFYFYTRFAGVVVFLLTATQPLLNKIEYACAISICNIKLCCRINFFWLILEREKSIMSINIWLMGYDRYAIFTDQMQKNRDEWYDQFGSTTRNFKQSKLCWHIRSLISICIQLNTTVKR